jgi:hypothetical protein
LLAPRLFVFWFQGPELEAFAKAASSNNETQFVGTDNFEIAKLLCPQISSNKNFVGLVKSENDKFEKFGKYIIFCQSDITILDWLKIQLCKY